MFDKTSLSPNFANRKALRGLLLIIAFAFHCGPTEPESWDFDITLMPDFVCATRVRLQANISDTLHIKDIVLERDGQEILRTRLSGSDTLLADNDAPPGTTCRYRLYLEKDAKRVLSSEVVTVQTLDTTRHGVEWTILKTGGYSSSLNDVFIIDEANIWAVGYINTFDSTYNAMHWNGTDWSSKSIETFYRGRMVSEPLSSIFAFTPNDIWANACYPIHWNSISWQLYHLTEMGIDVKAIFCCWGLSGQNMFFAGSQGFCIHFNGTAWLKIATGTGLSIMDIHGLSESLFYLVGDDDHTGETTFNIYNEGRIKVHQQIGGRFRGVYATASNDIYIAGVGIHYYDGKELSEIPWPENVGLYNLESVRGNGSNDIFFAGSYGSILHYNGINWHYYKELTNRGHFKAIAVSGELIVAVGTDGPNAVICHGIRRE